MHDLVPNNLPTRGFTFEQHPDMPHIWNTRINGIGFCFNRGGTNLCQRAHSLVCSEIEHRLFITAFEKAVGPEYLAELDAFIDANKDGPLGREIDSMCDDILAEHKHKNL